MPGPTDIATILSQTGRIEKINQSPFAHADVAKQILTEQEAQERLRSASEINESKRVREATDRQRKQERRQAKNARQENQDTDADQGDEKKGKKHLIDVVI